MNIHELSEGKRLLQVDIHALIASTCISEKRRERLTELKCKWEPGDRVLYYCSEKKEWEAGMGSEGYALVRNGEVIDEIVVKMN